jgi:ABC-type multidrug transport system permease subunit
MMILDMVAKVKEKRALKKAEKAQLDQVKYSYDIFVERKRLNPLIKLWFIMTKSLKLIIRSKTSALVFIFGPLFIIFLVSLAFNTSTLFDLNVATYSDSYSELSEDIMANLSDSQYHVLKLESESECIDAVKFSDFQVCLIFPADIGVHTDGDSTILIYVDNSRLNIASLISREIASKVSIESTELSEDIVSEILTVLDTSYNTVVDTQGVIEELKASNSELQSALNSGSSTLTGIDFSYSSIDTASIDSETTAIEEANNLSSSTFDTLNSLIDTVESTYSTSTANLDSASTSATSVATELSSLESSATSDAGKLDTAGSNLNTVVEGINGISVTNVDNIVTPISTSIEPISSTNSYLLYILPTILVLLIMFVSMLMSAASIITEKTSRAYFRNFITPTNDFLFMSGDFLSNFFILAFQVTVIIGVLYYFFGDLGQGTFLLGAAALLLIGSFFTLMGMFIGYLFNTKQTVTLAAISAGLTMLFFSNTILPLETLSSYTRAIVQYNPFIIGESLLKKIFLFQADFWGIAELVYLLAGFSIAVLIGSYLARKMSKKLFSST